MAKINTNNMSNVDNISNTGITYNIDDMGTCVRSWILCLASRIRSWGATTEHW
jgi:hypothetical protein